MKKITTILLLMVLLVGCTQSQETEPIEAPKQAVQTKEHDPYRIDYDTVSETDTTHDIKVIEGDKGLFIAMPSKKSADGEYRDIAHPINSDTRQLMQQMILDSYEKAAADSAQDEQLEADMTIE